MSRLTAAALAVAGLGACAVVATSLGQHQPDAPAAGTVAQGAVVVRDFETNALRAATPAEAAKYAATTSRKPVTTILRRADGSMSARLDDSHMIYTTVSRNADGQWVQACDMDHDHSVHAVGATVDGREVR